MIFSKLNKTGFFLPILVLIALLGSTGSAVYFYRQYRESLKEQKALTEIEQIVRKVSLLMELPQGETPTLATVSDKTQLQNQDFFQKAENGDRILVYSDARKAILYRPSIHKIIDVAPIAPLAEVAGEYTEGEEQSIKIALYNGSGIAGLAALAEEKLTQDQTLGKRIQVVAKEYSQSKYQGTMIVDLKGKQEQICQQIAKILSGKITSLPAGEKLPSADILIILGKQ